MRHLTTVTKTRSATQRLSISASQYLYLVREDEDVDDVEDGAENTDGDSQVAVYVVIILQHPSI